MTHYDTDEEQVAAIKKWFAENGKSLVLGIALAAGGVMSFQAWEKAQIASATEASSLYQELSTLVSNTEEKLTPEQQSTFAHLATTLTEEHKGSGYAIFAALFKAQQAVNANDLSAAQTELEWVLEQNTDENLKLIAQLRLARVLNDGTAEGAAKALPLVKDVEASSFTAAYAEAMGDIYMALGERKNARAAYERSLLEASRVGERRSLVQIKLDDLADVKEGA